MSRVSGCVSVGFPFHINIHIIVPAARGGEEEREHSLMFIDVTAAVLLGSRVASLLSQTWLGERVGGL